MARLAKTSANREVGFIGADSGQVLKETSFEWGLSFANVLNVAKIAGQ